MSKSHRLWLALALALVACTSATPPRRPATRAEIPAPRQHNADAGAPEVIPADEPAAPAPLGLAAPDGPLYQLPFRAASARVRRGALEMVADPQCELVVADPKSGSLTSRAALLAIHQGPAVECRCELAGDVVVCKDEARVAHAASIPGGAQLWTLSASDPDFDWSFAGLAAAPVLLEWPRARMKKLPPQRLMAVDPATGTPAWSEEIEGSTALVGRGFASDGARLVVWTGEDPTREAQLSLYAPSGRRVWQRAFPWSELGVLVDSDLVLSGHFVAFQRGHGATLIDAASGDVLLRVPLPTQARTTSLAVCGESMVYTQLATDGSTLVALDRTDGKQRFAITDPPHESSSAVCTKDRIFWQQDGQLSALDTTGRRLWSFSHGRPVQSELLLVHPELLLFTADRETSAFATASQLSERALAVTGKLKLTATVSGVRRSLAGIDVRVGNARTTTDDKGRFSLSVSGRGRAGVWVNAEPWLRAQKLRSPPFTFPCSREGELPQVNLEDPAGSAQIRVELKVEPCIVDP